MGMYSYISTVPSDTVEAAESKTVFLRHFSAWGSRGKLASSIPFSQVRVRRQK